MSIDTAFPSLRERHEALTLKALREAFAKQEADVVLAGMSLSPEWDSWLAQAVYIRNRNAAADAALKVASALGSDFDVDVMDEWLTANADIAARGINDSTRASLAEADDKAGVFAILLGSAAVQYARSMVTTAVNFGATDAARASGAGTKTWSGGTTRHGHLNGQTVPLDEDFSNGMAWPGDPSGGAEDLAYCNCSVIFN